ncbi:MAG: hypothetical protein WCC86_07170 [Methanoregula sp.]|uniref:hypothetical protein n=1 Tax=Methanoregula sp. TaxID=2052170 RepID=UPI003BAEA899
MSSGNTFSPPGTTIASSLDILAGIRLASLKNVMGFIHASIREDTRILKVLRN